MTILLNNTGNPITREERIKINENWQRIMSGYTNLQMQINVLAGGEELEELIRRLNETVENANVAVQNAIEANNTATQEAIETNKKALQTALDIVSQTLVDMNKAISNANTATSEANTAKQGALDATAQAQTAINTMQSLINNIGHKGEWSNTEQYYKNNMVEFNGSTFIALQNSTGKNPPTLPMKTNMYWSLFAERGNKGAKGDKGDTGAALSILGKLTDESQLPPTGHAGDAYTVNGELYVWSEVTGEWENVGNIKGEKGDTGDAGENGLSAYEVALDNGFVGTSEEWLASLKGEKGDAGKDPDLTEINQKVDGMQTEVTEHLIEIATTEKLGHFKPDGETLEVDRVTGVAKVIGGSGAKLYQENNTTFPTSSAIGNDNFVDFVAFAGICFSQNNSAKTVRVKNAATLYTNSPVSLRRIDGTWIDSIAISKTTVGDEVDIKLSDATDMSIAFIQIVQKYEGDITRSNQAFGSFNLSGGVNSTAIGKYSIATGHYSLAVGDSTQALGAYSLATGNKSSAITSNCVALGNNVVASALHSVALGDYSIASGQA
ncbi:hypothetical protein ACIPKN_02810, partial [Lysinibacillus sp. NPDC086135]